MNFPTKVSTFAYFGEISIQFYLPCVQRFTLRYVYFTLLYLVVFHVYIQLVFTLIAALVF